MRDRISIREISRRLDISHNTVRRYIRSDVSEPAYPARRSPGSPPGSAQRRSNLGSKEGP
ncbi:winged helix-turn-helix transcriptional regulator [Herbaspirillum robiniae]|uniref:winged helix-turn-helix transcriptional regulator n=1 Tax=Herbaspirillum robiniae TaxID=2014887 RepID=UPI000F0A479A